MLQSLEPRHHLSVVPVIQTANDAIEQSIITGNTIYYVEKQVSGEVAVKSYDISNKQTTVVPSPDGRTWDRVTQFKYSTDGLLFAGESNGKTSLWRFRAGETSATPLVRANWINMDTVQLAVNDTAAFFTARDKAYGLELYAYELSSGTVQRLTDLQAGPHWSQINSLTVTKSRAFFVSEGSLHNITAAGARSTTYTSADDVTPIGLFGGGIVFADNATGKLYHATAKANTVKSIGGDYVVDPENTPVVAWSGYLAFGGSSVSRGREFWYWGLNDANATPMADIAAGAANGWTSVEATASFFGSPGFYFSETSGPTYRVEPTRVVSFSWNRFSDAEYAVGSTYYVDQDGNLLLAGLTRRAGTLVDVGVKSIEADGDRLYVHRRDGIYIQDTGTAAVTGTVWLDSRRNQRFDVTEDRVGGVRLFADYDADGRLDTNEPSAVSDENGVYRLTGLKIADYTITIAPGGTYFGINRPTSYIPLSGTALRVADFGVRLV